MRIPLRGYNAAVPGQLLGHPDVSTRGMQDNRHEVVPEGVWRDLANHIGSKCLFNPAPDYRASGLCGHTPELMDHHAINFLHIGSAMASEDRQRRDLSSARLIEPASFI